MYKDIEHTYILILGVLFFSAFAIIGILILTKLFKAKNIDFYYLLLGGIVLSCFGLAGKDPFFLMIGIPAALVGLYKSLQKLKKP